MLFLVGSLLDSMQIYDSPDKLSAQYANAVAVSFTVGTSIFLCGCIPFLFEYRSFLDTIKIVKFISNQFIAGSVLFFWGGLLNICRFQHVSKLEHQGRADETLEKEEVENPDA